MGAVTQRVKPRRVGLVTYSGEPTLTEDDRLLIPGLAMLGVEGLPVIWDDKRERWRECDALVLRSTWDYHLRPDEFRGWIDAVERAGLQLWNSPEVVRWNMHKRYLLDLEQRGVRIPETILVERGSEKSLESVLPWDDAVVKPAISASATNTWRVILSEAKELQVKFRELTRTSDVIVQRYMPEVARDGELSLVFIAGEFSHAFHKRARVGEFRVQPHLGGRVDRATPTPENIATAAGIVHGIPGPWIYVRVDGV